MENETSLETWFIKAECDLAGGRGEGAVSHVSHVSHNAGRMSWSQGGHVLTRGYCDEDGSSSCLFIGACCARPTLSLLLLF